MDSYISTRDIMLRAGRIALWHPRILAPLSVPSVLVLLGELYAYANPEAPHLALISGCTFFVATALTTLTCAMAARLATLYESGQVMLLSQAWAPLCSHPGGVLAWAGVASLFTFHWSNGLMPSLHVAQQVLRAPLLLRGALPATAHLAAMPSLLPWQTPAILLLTACTGPIVWLAYRMALVSAFLGNGEALSGSVRRSWRCMRGQVWLCVRVAIACLFLYAGIFGLVLTVAQTVNFGERSLPVAGIAACFAAPLLNCVYAFFYLRLRAFNHNRSRT